jgi:hypothetical protein
VAAIGIVTLGITDAEPGKKKVTVNFDITFSQEDVGKKFRASVSLWPAQGDGDGEENELLRPVPNKALYTFRFKKSGLGMPFPEYVDYLSIKPTSAGTWTPDQPITTTLEMDELDEDPAKKVKIKIPVYTPERHEIVHYIWEQQDDEVTARVTLLPVGEEISKSSAKVEIPIPV